MKAPRKITIAQCVRQGHTVLTFYCQTERASHLRPYGGGPNVCGHSARMHSTEAVAIWGEDARLSELHGLVCSVCGGRDVDVRATWPGEPFGYARPPAPA